MAQQEMPEPKFPQVEEWSLLQKLNREREVIGFYLSGHPLDPYKPVMRRFTKGDLSTLDDYKNQEVKLAGIVTQATERISRNGTRFGVFTLEDYQTSLTFSLFREQYANLAKLLEVNHAVLIQGRYEPSYRDPDNFELRVRAVRLLEDVMEEDMKEISLQVGIQDITPEFNQQLLEVLDRFPGKTPIALKVHNGDQTPPIRLVCDKQVKPLAELFTALDALPLNY